MKNLKLFIILLCFVMSFSTFAFAKAKPRSISPQKNVKANTIAPAKIKGAKVVSGPGPFIVQNVTFKLVPINGKSHLAAALVFNKNIDKSTVKEGLNIRLLRKNQQHFWLDASTQNNNVRIGPNFITWLCGKPIDNAVYVIHLRGTIRSSDGIYLDCDGDGKGEGGSLPAYESKLYQIFPRLIESNLPDELESLLR